MATHTTPWTKVGAQFDKLTARLRTDVDAVGEDAGAERAALETALRAVVKSLEDVATSAGKAVRDPALRKDFAQFVSAMRDALTATVDSMASQARQRLAQREPHEVEGAYKGDAHAGETHGHTARTHSD